MKIGIALLSGGLWPKGYQSRTFMNLQIISDTTLTSDDLIPLWAIPTQPPNLTNIPIGLEPPKLIEQNHTPRRQHKLPDEEILKWFAHVETNWGPKINSLGFVKDSDLEKSAYLMLYGFATQHKKTLNRLITWKYPPFQNYYSWLIKRCDNAVKYKIWLGNRNMHATWLDKTNNDQADIQFVLDVMLINGDMHRIRNKYHLSAQGKLALN